MLKRHFKKITALATLAVILGAIWSAMYAVNAPFAQRAVFAALSKAGYDFSFTNDDGSIKISPLFGKITVKSLLFASPSTKNSFSIDSAELKINPFGLLRGRLIVTDLNAKGFVANFAPQQQKKKSQKISIKKLLLLQNLQIDSATLEGANLYFEGIGRLSADMAALEFKPRITGEVNLKTDLQGAKFDSAGESVQLASMELRGRTKLTDWIDTPPYVNSIKGRLGIGDLKYGEIEVSNIAAKVAVLGPKIEMSDFELVTGKKPIAGSFSINFDDDSFAANIETKEAIPVPTLGAAGDPTIDTQGLVEAKIKLEGTGLDLEHSQGKADIWSVHMREGLPNVEVSAPLSWKDGVIKLNDTKVKIGETGNVDVKGSVDIAGKKLDIKVNGGDIPVEGVFGRFGDENFHPIFGTAEAVAQVTGWGENFKVSGDASTTGVGGYYKIKCDKAHARIEATYKELTLVGEIFQKEREAGNIDMKIKYGKKTSNKPRPKDLFIDAKAVNNDLTQSMGDYGLHGIGNAHMRLEGPKENFKALITATIDEGEFANVGFQKLSTKADLRYNGIKFTEATITRPNSDPIIFQSPLNIDFQTGSIHFSGSPIDGLAIDANYATKSGDWSIKNVRYKDLVARGNYSATGANNLSIDGSADLSLLMFFKNLVREASGPAKVAIKIGGTGENPQINGSLKLQGNTIYPRSMYQSMEEISGEIDFSGRKISTDGLTGTIQDGKFSIKGYLEHASLEPQRFDMAFKGENLRFLMWDKDLKTELNVDLKWSGTAASSLLEGNVVILDGKYTKDFSIFEGLSSSKNKNALAKTGDDKLRLKLNIRNTGDLAIRNNIGDIWLSADLNVTGTEAKPQVNGRVETQDGKIHYLGHDFTITRGFVEFRDPYTNPYIEVTAEYDVPNITDLVITALLHGRLDNLTVDLSATKPMERRDIISMLLFGVTEEDAKNAQSSFGGNVGPSIVAGQITAMIERPITKFTHLDIFRLEAAGTQTTTSSGASATQISKVYLGKQLSDRLSLSFMTDINTEYASQTVQAEYLLTDSLLLKGERLMDDEYLFNFSLRFRER